MSRKTENGGNVMNDFLSVSLIRAYSEKSGRVLPYDTLAASDKSFTVVKDGDGQTVPAGCAVYIPDASRCRVEGEGEVSFISFEAVLYGGLALFSLYDMPEIFGSDVALPVIAAANTAKEQLFTSLIENEIEIKRLMWCAVSAAISQSQPIEAQADIAGRHRVFAPVFRYIADHAGETVAMEKLVSLTELSKDTFYRTFKKTVGMPPRDYMLRERLVYAGRLLFTTDLSVRDIAKKAGYASPSAFGSAFSEKYGTAPGRYRGSLREVKSRK